MIKFLHSLSGDPEHLSINPGDAQIRSGDPRAAHFGFCGGLSYLWHFWPVGKAWL